MLRTIKKTYFIKKYVQNALNKERVTIRVRKNIKTRKKTIKN